MYTHSIHNELLLRNVRVEVVYESSPTFADEEVSAIIRLRHLGDPKTEEPIEVAEANTNGNGNQHNGNEVNDEHKENNKHENGNGWFGSRLSTQLSNTARALFLEELESGNDTNKAQATPSRNKPVSLISGYVQLSGYFTYDPEVIKHEEVDSFRTKAAVSGKIGGLEGLEVSKINNNGLFSLFTNTVGGLFNTSIDDLRLDEIDNTPIDKKRENLIPFFTTSQSLLFSTVELQDGNVKEFYFKCKLPKGLPPTYDGSSIKINYDLIVGASLDEQIPKPLNIHFPLKVSTYFDEFGFQPISHLDRFILLPSSNIINEPVEFEKNHKRRRSSFKTIKTTVLVKPEISESDKKLRFISKMKDLLNDDNYDLNSNDFKHTNVKDLISTYLENLENKGKIDESEPKFKTVNDYILERQINKLQTKYIISRNNESITTLVFSKPFYKIGEQIKISFDFQNKDLKTTGILIRLENLELIKDSYSYNKLETQKKPRAVNHFKETFTTFDLEDLTVGLPIPINATSQFKTNIFESRWALSVKFILSNDETLEEIYKDKAGSLLLSKRNLSGSEFSCRLPIYILPSDQDHGGIP